MSHWCVLSNVDPDYFYGKLSNRYHCTKTRSTISHEWCVDVLLNSLIGGNFSQTGPVEKKNFYVLRIHA